MPTLNFNRLAILLLGSVVFFAAGCATSPELMPTPNLYAKDGRDPFPDVPAGLQNNKVDVLYLTDRVPEEGSTPENHSYGFRRSRLISSGVSTVEIGKDVSWKDLELIRDQSLPGPERPLNTDPKGFWFIDDQYPKFAKDKESSSK